MSRLNVFSAVGTIVEEGQKKKLKLNSPRHWEHHINKLIPGKKYGIVVEEFKASRSDQQLKYYWVLLSYLAEYSGHEPEELHDAILRKKFGTKQIVLGDIKESVRRSIAHTARFPLSEMVELIEEVLQICSKVGVVIPTKEELGYL